MNGPTDHAPRSAIRRTAFVPLAASLFMGVFLLGVALYAFAVSFGYMLSDFLFFNPVRTAALSLGAFGFNWCFGTYFGAAYGRTAQRAAEGPPARQAAFTVVNPGLLGCAGWWLLFALPVVLTVWAAGESAGFAEKARELAMTALTPGRWPEAGSSLSARTELALFYPLGTMGLMSGFFLGFFAVEYRRMRRTGRGKA